MTALSLYSVSQEHVLCRRSYWDHKKLKSSQSKMDLSAEQGVLDSRTPQIEISPTPRPAQRQGPRPDVQRVWRALAHTYKAP